MKKLFADTYFFMALLNTRDSGHQQAKLWLSRILQEKTKLITTGFVLLELGNSISSLPARGHFADLLSSLNKWKTIILPVNQRLLREGISLYCDRLDKTWSVVDCTSFIVMKQHRIQDALTEDHHFEQAGFRCLLKT
jgi:predicted nucleic acid-binding protein